jgi:hypothetical protein
MPYRNVVSSGFAIIRSPPEIRFTIRAPVRMQIVLQVLNGDTCRFEVLHQASRASMSVCLVQNSSLLLPSAHELKFSLIFFAPFR